MKKQFLFNILLLVLLNALIKPFWVFGIDRSVQNMVGTEAYGLYFAFFNFTILFNTILDFGITNFNNRSISQTPGLLAQYFPRFIMLKLLLGFAYLFVCLIVSFWLGYSKAAYSLIAILALNQFLASLLLFLRSNISGMQLFTVDSILSVVDRFIMIILCGILIWTNLFPFTLNIYLFALLQTFAYGFTCLVALLIILKHNGVISFRNISPFSGNLFRKSLPYALLGLLMVIHNRIDAVFLERLAPRGAIEAGIYAQSFRIFDAIVMVSVIFASLLLPMLSRLLADKSDIKPLLGMTFSFLITGTVILAINLIGFAQPLMDKLYVQLEPKSVNVFIILIFCIIPVSLSYIFGTLLTADGRLFHLNIIAGITLLINVATNIILIPVYGAVGAALSALVSQLFASLSQILICKKRYHFVMSVKKLIPYLVLISLSILITALFSTVKIHVLLSIGLSLLISFIISFLLKIINLNEIFFLLKPEYKPR